MIGVARSYLGVDHPSDAWVSLVFAPAVAVLVFRLFAPEAAFPVSWKRGVTAHLDVSGRRGDAIKSAVRDQLGLAEDEVRFASVRRLVEYEDYVQRLMRDCGIPSAEPFGVVEITPEREYLMVSQFLFGSEELTDAEIDEEIIDDALGVIRQMWDAGVAHRDIKPGKDATS